MASPITRPGENTAVRLEARDLTLSYEGRTVIANLTLAIPDNSFTVIIGPNACGKSTLLRGLARLLKPRSGEVLLDGEPIWSRRAREVARHVGLLSQTATAPEGISIADLVANGRFPHQTLFERWTREDERAVSAALAATGLSALGRRSVDELSGGQRQRAWIAMLLAQQTPIMLLDEPTTFLDISHQAEVLDLCETLRLRRGATIVAVLHDVNQACRYATHLVAMRDGRILSQGTPSAIVSEELIARIFDVPCRVLTDPETSTPLIVPRKRPL